MKVYLKTPIRTPKLKRLWIVRADAPTSSIAWVSTQPIAVQADTACQFVCAEGREVVGQGSTGSCDI